MLLKVLAEEFTVLYLVTCASNIITSLFQPNLEHRAAFPSFCVPDLGVILRGLVSKRRRRRTSVAAMRVYRRVSGAHVLSHRWGWGFGTSGTISHWARTAPQGSVVYISPAGRCGTAGGRRKGGRRPARTWSTEREIRNTPNTSSHRWPAVLEWP